MTKELSLSQQGLDLIPLSQWNEYYDFPTVNALRQLAFRNTDNINKCIRKIGGRLYIKISEFLQWVEEVNS